MVSVFRSLQRLLSSAAANMVNPTQKPKVYIIGVGMTKFTKPQSVPGLDYPDLVKEAVNKALTDAKVKYSDIQQATVGYLYGGSCCAQRALYEVGMTGIPIYNVNNACASGSSGLYMCKQFIETGNTDLALAVGFEKMAPGSLENMGGRIDDRAIPVEKHIGVMSETYGLFPAPMTAQMFGNAGKEHMEKYGTKPEHFAKIAWKNHKHSVNNPNSQFQKEYTLEEVMKARRIYDFMGLLECSPTSDGAAAAVLCSEKFLREHPHLKDQAVEILGMQLGTDFPSAFEENSNIKMIGFDMIKAISGKLYKETGLGPNDVQVIECHDCFAPNELITYEALGLCPVGKGGEIVDRGDNTYGGKWVINPSGGLISKGHPIGATGVAQAVELSWQLRGEAGKRQVPNARVAMQHNIGIGGAGVVAMYKLANPKYPQSASVQTSAGHGGSAHGPKFESDDIFAQIKTRAAEEKELAKKVQSSFRFNITNGPNGATKQWTIDLKSDTPFVGQKDGAVDCELTVKDADFMQIAAGKLKPDQAFMQGKMKLKGNIAKAMKLKDILDVSKLKAKL